MSNPINSLEPRFRRTSPDLLINRKVNHSIKFKTTSKTSTPISTSPTTPRPRTRRHFFSYSEPSSPTHSLISESETTSDDTEVLYTSSLQATENGTTPKREEVQYFDYEEEDYSIYLRSRYNQLLRILSFEAECERLFNVEIELVPVYTSPSPSPSCSSKTRTMKQQAVEDQTTVTVELSQEEIEEDEVEQEISFSSEDTIVADVQKQPQSQPDGATTTTTISTTITTHCQCPQPLVPGNLCAETFLRSLKLR